MLFAIAVLLTLIWFLCYSVFSVTGGLIHILLLLAAIAFVGHFVRQRRAAWSRDHG